MRRALVTVLRVPDELALKLKGVEERVWLGDVVKGDRRAGGVLFEMPSGNYVAVPVGRARYRGGNLAVKTEWPSIYLKSLNAFGLPEPKVVGVWGGVSEDRLTFPTYFKAVVLDYGYLVSRLSALEREAEAARAVGDRLRDTLSKVYAEQAEIKGGIELLKTYGEAAQVEIRILNESVKAFAEVLAKQAEDIAQLAAALGELVKLIKEGKSEEALKLAEAAEVRAKRLLSGLAA
jgi:hypothetical protein